jgi:hypothetical protein
MAVSMPDRQKPETKLTNFVILYKRGRYAGDCKAGTDQGWTRRTAGTKKKR